MTLAPPELRANYRPVDEADWAEVPLRGDVAGLAGLEGTYVRNGPNRDPSQPRGGLWFAGTGMVHAVRIAGGRAWYAHRRIGVPGEPAASGLVACDGELLAFGDTGRPARVDARSLRRVGVDDVDDPRFALLPHAVCTPAGRLLTLATAWDDDAVRIVERVPGRGWRVRGAVAMPGRPFLHDVALVGDRLVVLDLPWRRGADGPRWQPERGARVGLVDLDGNAARWFDVTPTHVTHVVSACTRDGVVEVVVCRRPTPGVAAGERNPFEHDRGSVRRFTLDTARGVAREEDLDDVPGDFPVRSTDGRVAFVARPVPGNGTVCAGVVRVDLGEGRSVEHVHGPGRFGGEMRVATTGDGREVLVGFVHDVARERSELVVLDAADLGAPPLATVALPGRVPWGLHGAWVPDGSAQPV